MAQVLQKGAALLMPVYKEERKLNPNKPTVKEQGIVSASEIQIREAKLEDCISLYRMDSKLLRTAEEDSLEYQQLIQSHDGLVLVAEREGLKGFIAARKGRSTWISVATICALAVDSDGEKDNIEDLLLSELIKRLQGVNSLYIELSSRSAVKSYLKRGFSVIKRYRRESGSIRHEVTRMVLRLSGQGGASDAGAEGAVY